MSWEKTDEILGQDTDFYLQAKRQIGTFHKKVFCEDCRNEYPLLEVAILQIVNIHDERDNYIICKNCLNDIIVDHISDVSEELEELKKELEEKNGNF
jgi:hypothetical protein